jgi:hypothetical protein
MTSGLAIDSRASCIFGRLSLRRDSRSARLHIPYVLVARRSIRVILISRSRLLGCHAMMTNRSCACLFQRSREADCTLAGALRKGMPRDTAYVQKGSAPVYYPQHDPILLREGKYCMIISRFSTSDDACGVLGYQSRRTRSWNMRSWVTRDPPWRVHDAGRLSYRDIHTSLPHTCSDIGDELRLP